MGYFAVNVRENAAKVRMVAVEVRGLMQLKYESVGSWGFSVTEALIRGLGEA
jgi:hypothetical protein